jgi:hypothetical protein
LATIYNLLQGDNSRIFIRQKRRLTFAKIGGKNGLYLFALITRS